MPNDPVAPAPTPDPTPDRKPFTKTDQTKVNDTKSMPPARVPLPEKVASPDGKGGVVHRGPKKKK